MNVRETEDSFAGTPHAAPRACTPRAGLRQIRYFANAVETIPVEESNLRWPSTDRLAAESLAAPPPALPEPRHRTLTSPTNTIHYHQQVCEQNLGLPAMHARELSKVVVCGSGSTGHWGVAAVLTPGPLSQQGKPQSQESGRQRNTTTLRG
ncbi:hypothetical protein VTK26DRAFT_7853 [Humicola hyalothermophila]